MIYDLETGTRRRSRASRVSRFRLPRLNTFGTIALLVVILAVGGYLRSINLANWDERQGLHPDERFVSVAVGNLSLPASLSQYWDSASSPLNPRNFDWSRMWVYGTLPATITRVVATMIERPQDVLIVGRALSGFFDLVACVALFGLGRLLHGRKAGLLAAALYALTVMSIQQAHFFTTDNFAVAFATLALVSATRLGVEGRWRDALLAGLWTGAAVASKINLAVLAAIVGVGALQYYARRIEHSADTESALRGAPLRSLLRAGWLLLAAGVVTFVAFRVFQPDAFTGPNIWNIWPEPRFLDNLRTVRGLVDGTIDMPPSHQWASRIPYLWPWQNMVLWGMGVPLGLMSWLGWGVAGLRLFRRARRGLVTLLTWRFLVPWVWIALYWAWQGRGFNPSLRYFLPIYPPLILFAALASLEGGRWLRRRAGRWMPGRAIGRRALIGFAPTAVLLFCTAAWAWGFTRIYTRPHSRIAAGEWMVATQPHGSYLTTEQWDDALPYTNGNGNNCSPFCLIETTPYAEDEPSKYLGKNDPGAALDPNLNPDGLIAQIARADYVVLSSARVYSSIERLPHRFPVTMRYYQSLFDGSLGFDLVGDFHSFPSFLGMPVPDLAAEEQFTVYDHPRVLIFKRTDRFNPALARDLLTRDVVWSEMYRISAKLTSAAPNALRVTDRSWERLQETSSSYLWNNPLANALRLVGVPNAEGIAGMISLVLAVELLGLATLGIVRRWGMPLADHGVVSSRFVGLLLFAAPLAACAYLDRFTVSRTLLGLWYGIIVGFGLRLAWAERGTLRARLRRHRSLVVAGNSVYAVVLMVGLLLRALAPSAPVTATAFGLAQWTAMARAPILPPPDPLFAGGTQAIPYAAMIPASMLTRMAGVAPDVAYGVWSALLLALLAGLVWGVAARLRGRMLPVLLAALVLVPGMVAGTATPVGAVLLGNIAMLATAVLTAGTLVVARGAMLPALAHTDRWRGGSVLALAATICALTLLRAQAPVGFWVVALSAVALLATARNRHPAKRGILALLLTLLPLALAHPLMVVVPTLSVGASTLNDAAGVTSLTFVLRWVLVLVVMLASALLVATRLIERRVLAVVGGGLVAVLALGVVMGLSPLVVLSPLLLVLLWVLLEAITTTGSIQRVAPAFFVALVGVALFAISGRMATERLPGDSTTLFGVALVLCVSATDWIVPHLPSGRRPYRHVVPLLSLALPVALIATIYLALPTARLAMASANVDDDTGGVVAALVEDAANGSVIALAPQSGVPHLVARTGLPALVADPDATGTIRQILQPSVGAVIDGRRAALNDIFGADPGRATVQLAAYGIGYVAVGPTERALYGDTAGTALRALESTGAVSVLYEDASWTLFRHNAASEARTVPYVAPTAGITLPSIKDGMLAQPLASLPVVDEYGWNTWATGDDLAAIALWLLLFELVGLLALPLSNRIFARSTDGGWAWSKLIGLVVWGYAIWLPVSLNWWTYQWPSLVAGALILAALSWLALGRPQRVADVGRRFARPGGTRVWLREVVRVESIYLLAFGAMTLIRMANPDLWHPWLGGEKPFEFGMLNAIVRSPVMPPPDPFFSGGVINYYYYGLFLVSVPIRATGLDPAVAFNLIVPSLFAFVIVGSASVVRILSGYWRWGVLGALMVGVLGPAASAVRFGESRGLGPVIAALREGVSGWGGRIGDWFWGPSRIIPNTINEFPFFAYLFADLHPHMIALPITILGIAIAVELYRAPALRRQGAAFGIAALVIGTLAAANSWDAPTSAFVLGGVLIGRAWRVSRRGTTGSQKLRELGRGALIAVALLAGGLALVTPFFMSYQAMVGGIGRVREGDSVLQWVAIGGANLYVALSVLIGIAWAVAQRFRHAVLRRSGRMLATGMGTLLIVVLLGAWAWGSAAQAEGGRFPVLTLMLAVLVAVAVTLAFVARLRDEEWLVLWLIIAALMVALGIQVVFVRDHLSGGDWERMNTVFKFGLQIWTLLALAAAAGIPMVTRLLQRRGEAAVSAWIGPLVLLLLMGATYPVVGTASRTALRFEEHPGLTLDGLAFMDTARYESGGQPIDMSGDAEAIRWLKQNITGLPVIVQSEAEFYRANGVRIAANTGFPTVLGRLHQDEQRPAAGVLAREADVKLLYNTTDETTATSILAKYAVDYVYVGPAERAFYNQAGLAKWDALEGRALDTVYQNDAVRIYRVRPGLKVAAIDASTGEAPASEPAPEPAPPDPNIEGLEEAQAAQPNDPATAYTLANAYIQNGRAEDAARVLTAAAAANPGDIALHQFLGDVQARIGNAEAAIAAWQAAADINPTSGNISKLGTGLTSLGRYDEADPVFERALRADPNDALVHFYIAENARQRNATGDAQRAREEYMIYLQQAPADSPFRGTAEEALRSLGQ